MNMPWNIDLVNMPGFGRAMERVYAWYEGEMLDRPPIRFSRHNADFDNVDACGRTWPTLKDRWMDAPYQIEKFEASIRGKTFHAETFPVFWPNLGPNVFAACYGMPYIFGEVTAWTEPIIEALANDYIPKIDWRHPYIKKLDELTNLALERAGAHYLVGYTDMHPGIDCVAAWRGSEQLLYDLVDGPEAIERLCTANEQDFLCFYDHYDHMLKKHQQLSATWMNIPSFGKMHIPSCDFSSMISTADFKRIAYDAIAKECERMDHNIFHVDGKGVARHLDVILSLPNLHGIQWVQGVGADAPMLQWAPLIERVQKAGKGVVVDVAPAELDSFMKALSPKGLYLCIAAESEEEELRIIERVEKW